MAYSKGVDKITTTAAAQQLGISPRRVQQLIHDGRLPAAKVGRDYLINQEDLMSVAERKPGRPPKFAVTSPDMPVQTHADVFPDMEAAETIDDARAIYDKLLTFHRRTWKERSGWSSMGLPQSPEAQTFTTLNQNLQRFKAEEQRNRFAGWLQEIHNT